MRRVILVCSALALLVGASSDPPGAVPDLLVSAPRELEPGSVAVVHARLLESVSLAESRAVAGADLSAFLEGRAGRKLVSARTDENGVAQLVFEVPQLEGAFELRVSGRAPSGPVEHRFDVKLARKGKVLLVTDKPLYQPGQVVHLRALALSEISGRPLAGVLTFEVDDAKGNKLFKQKVELSPFGVASVRMPIAAEVNDGQWQARAFLGDANAPLAQAQRPFEVKRYSLPKFKLTATADQRTARPGDAVLLDVEARYFFGKPVQGEAVVEASLEGQRQRLVARLDANGKHRFELKAPAPSGDEGPFSLSVTVTDTADHEQSTTASVIVSKQPLKVAVVPESAALRPGLGNRVYAVVTAPDGSPQRAKLSLELGGQKHEAESDESGVAVFELVPPHAGASHAWTPRGHHLVHHAMVRATGRRGEKAEQPVQLRVDAGPALLLRPERVLLTAGKPLSVEVRAAKEIGQATVELWKGPQLVAAQEVPLANGLGSASLTVPDFGGTLELRGHAFVPGGQIAHAARVLYAAPARALEVKVTPDRETYAPGDRAVIRFQVTGANGGAPAAIGVVAVDESVYALQDIQPGLERAFFTVATQLAMPDFWKGQKPPTDLEDAVRSGDFSDKRERLARVLLAAAEPEPEPGHRADPRVARYQKAAAMRTAYYVAFGAACAEGCIERHGSALRYKPSFSTLLSRMVEQSWLSADLRRDPFGRLWEEKAFIAAFPELSPPRIAKVHDARHVPQLWQQLVQLVSQNPRALERFGPRLVGDLRERMGAGFPRDGTGQPYSHAVMAQYPGFTKDELAASASAARLQTVVAALSRLAYEREGSGYRYFDQKKQRFTLPDDALEQCLQRKLLTPEQLEDAYGTPFRIVRGEGPNVWNHAMRGYRFYSAGPDRKHGTGDDVDLSMRAPWQPPSALMAALQLSPEEQQFLAYGNHWQYRRRDRYRRPVPGKAARAAADDMPMAKAEALAPEEPPEPLPPATAPAPDMGGLASVAAGKGAGVGAVATKAAPGSTAPITRVRQWFPETLFFAPAVLTDERGHAELPVELADSITTWRVSALASGLDGALGSAAVPLNVFQDFFVDLDLPPTLTQGDEVSVPVAVYNYLKTSQRVALSLGGDRGLRLLGPAEQVVDIGPGEVKGVSFRVKATVPGERVFALTARGEKKSDAVRRTVHVKPDGEEVAQVINRELGSGGTFELAIPPEAIPEASKILVRITPGVVAAIADGVEGLIRAPGG